MFRTAKNLCKLFYSIEKYYPKKLLTKFQSPDKFTQIFFHNSCKMFQYSATNLKDVPEDDIKYFLNSFDTVLTDCDGVLWISDNEIPGSAKAINGLRNMGKKIFYVTNNSTKVREEFAEKARKLGFTATRDEILSTSYLVAHYLNGINFKDKVYIVGSEGIGGELDAVGIRHIGIGPDNVKVKHDFRNLKPSDLDKEVKAVVVGFDEHISYPKLLKAASYLDREEVLFLATNTDERFPKGGGIVVPGTGSIVRAVEVSAERDAIVLGKPHAYVRKYLEACGIDPKRTIMIGDRCNTDIELGVRCGFKTLLVMSGVTSEKDLAKMRTDRKPPIPDVVLPKLGDLVPFLPTKF